MNEQFFVNATDFAAITEFLGGFVAFGFIFGVTAFMVGFVFWFVFDMVRGGLL